MPETPDFDQIATQWITEWRTGKGLGEVTLETLVAEQLRLVWNARGAADIEAAKEAEGDRGGAPYPDLDAIVEDIRSLDR